MDTKIINWKDEFTKLFPESTERKLKDNHKWCNKCNGIGFSRHGEFINFCTSCRGSGQIELCTEGCGKEKDNYYSICKECREKLDFERRIKKEKEHFEKATKIKYDNYDGMFLVNDRVMDKDDFEEYLYYLIFDNEEEIPTYVYSTEKQQVMSINFTDIIENACEEGYEDMETYLDYEGVNEIQKAIDNWIEKQGDRNYSYCEDYKVVILLEDLIKELQIQKEKNCIKQNA